MPRLFNAENSWVRSFAVVSMASNTTSTQTWTGVTTDDVILGVGTNTTAQKCGAYISAADVVAFGPCAGTVAAQSTIAQTVWLQLMKTPTTNVLGGSL